jgi:hypothetical protein
MFHLNTEQLIDYWRARRGADPVPRRSSIDPTHVLNLLPQLFMLGRLGPGQYQFRLAGDFVGELHGRALRQQDFLHLWQAEDRTSLQMALEAVRRRGEPLVVTCHAQAQAVPAMRMEIALTPVSGSNGEVNRFLGLYQPTSPVAKLMGQPVTSLSIRAINTPDSAEDGFPRLRLAAMSGKRIA